jgi:transposase
MDEVDDADLVVQRVAALDLGKAGLEACVRVPHPQRPGRRMQELRGYATTTAQLLAMAAWLRHWGVQRVVMESTSTYWKGVYYLLEAEGFDCWLVNAREVKNMPGRAKTDRADAVWLAKVAERGMCRPSLVQPPEIRRLRDLTRYRRALVQDRTRERQRVEKLLEDAQIKMSAVLSDLHGVTGRAMRCLRNVPSETPRARASRCVSTTTPNVLGRRADRIRSCDHLTPIPVQHFAGRHHCGAGWAQRAGGIVA